MMDISILASNLEEIEEGFWMNKGSNLLKLSYPTDGHDVCFEIEEESFWFNHRNNCLIEVFKRFPPNGTVFDLGGGNGFVSLGLMKAGMDVVLIEPGIVGARNALSRGIKPIVCSTLEEASFKKETLPAIGIFDVLEHIEDDEGFLKVLRSYLIQKGKIYLTVPAHNFLWSNEDNLAGHYRRYSLDQLNQKIEKVGFKVIYKTYFFSFLMLPIFLFRTLPTKFKIRKGNVTNFKNEHTSKSFNKLLNIILSKELSTIEYSYKSFGASCLIVAEKLD